MSTASPICSSLLSTPLVRRTAAGLGGRGETKAFLAQFVFLLDCPTRTRQQNTHAQKWTAANLLYATYMDLHETLYPPFRELCKWQRRHSCYRRQECGCGFGAVEYQLNVWALTPPRRTHQGWLSLHVDNQCDGNIAVRPHRRLSYHSYQK